MAKSENQGLQIAVIIFAFLTIALSVATFYFFNEYSSAATNAIAMNDKAKVEEDKSRVLLDERNALFEMIGESREKKLADVAARHTRDMSKGMTNFNAKEKWPNYSQAIELMITTVEQLKADTRRENAELTKLAEDIKVLKEAYDKSVANTKQEFDTQVGNFVKRLGTYANNDQMQVAKVKELTADLDKKRDELQKLIETKTAEIQKVQSDLKNAIADASRANKIRMEVLNQTFDRPDGKVVAVNPKDNTVWIDVGRNDGLRLNLRFTVYERGESNVYKRQPKGAIEVKRFLGESMAEANIVQLDLKNLILEGDVIATPVWSPGDPERYLIAGDFDVNRDGKKDLDDFRLLQTLVDMGGGVIDAEVSIRTKYALQGELTSNVRYVLLGDAPAEKPGADEYTNITKKAKALSIKVMTLAEFLDYTGGRDLLRRATSLAPNSEAVRETMKNKGEGVKQGGFRARTPEEGLRRLEPGAAPRKANEGPDRRPGPAAEKTGAAKSDANNPRGGAYRN